MNSKQRLLLSMAFLMVAGCSTSPSQGGPNGAMRQGQMASAQQAVAVEVETMAKGDLTITKKIFGNVNAEYQSDVFSSVSGKLLSLHVQKGDTVQQGQKLATVDISDTQEAILTAKIGVESAKQQLQSALIAKKETEQRQSSLEKLKLNWDNAKKTLQNNQTLYEHGAISLDELDQSRKAEAESRISYEEEASSLKTGKEKAQLSIDEAELNIKKAEIGLQETLKESQDIADDGVISAPISGEVIAINYTVGEEVSGQQALLTISDHENLKITTAVTADQKGLLPMGKELQVKSTRQDQPFTAKVIFVSGAANENGLFDVDLQFSANQMGLASGEVVELNFTETLVKNELIVPTRAILQKGDTSYVYTVVDGKAVQKKVEIINSQTDKTAVKGELEEGAALVVNGHKLLSDGMNVLLPGQKPTAAPTSDQGERSKRGQQGPGDQAPSTKTNESGPTPGGGK